MYIYLCVCLCLIKNYDILHNTNVTLLDMLIQPLSEYYI